MDKNTTVSLPEIKAEIEELRSRLKALEAKIAEYEAVPDVPADFTDIEIAIGELPEPEEISPRGPEDLGRDDNRGPLDLGRDDNRGPLDLGRDDNRGPLDLGQNDNNSPLDLGQDDSAVISSEVEKSPEIPVEDDLPEAEPVVAEPKPEPTPEAAPVQEPVPAPEPAPAPAKKARKKAEPSAEKDAKPYAWMLDVPQMSVKNIRSAISLQDRALFIKTLFKEDFALYDSTISALNAMENSEQASAYIKENFQDWNLRSDIVYEFMMAVRKKLG